MRSVKNKTKTYEIRGDIKVGDLAEDGTQLRPFIVWFEEEVPMLEYAAGIVAAADIFAVIGTSLQVYPAAGLVNYAPKPIPKFIIDKKIPAVTHLSNIQMIESSAGTGVQQFIQKLKQIAQ
jgi:NAD-dependent deacetylase